MAFLSLSSLPLLGIFRQHQAVLAYGVGGDWRQYLAGLLTLPEVTREYSIVAAFLTLQAFVLAAIVARETRRTAESPLLPAAAIACGLAVFVTLGLAEVFAGVSLEALRGTAAVFARSGTLQATAGNPGWFAEFMVYALPYGLVLLAGEGRSLWRLISLTLFAGAVSVGIVLGYQRGGWVAGLVVLLYLVAAVALVLRGSGTAAPPMRSLVVRLLGGLALLAVVAVAASYLWLGRAGAHAGPGSVDRAAFAARLASIADADRIVYWRAAAMVGGLHPILGGGAESFAYRYRAYFLQPGGVYHASPVRVPDASSAHSLYGQVFSGMGVAGLLVLLALLGRAALGTARAVRDPRHAGPARVVLLAAFGSLVGMAAYGLVQEVFYVHALRLLFFVNVGLLAGTIPARTGTSPGTRHLAAAALAAVLFAHLVYENSTPGPRRLVAEGEATGFYQQEHDPAGKPYRWSTEWAALPVPAGATTYSVELRSVAPFPQQVEITACGKEQEVTLSDQAWRRVTGPANCGAGLVEIEVVPAWRPPAEERLLGVMVSSFAIR